MWRGKANSGNPPIPSNVLVCLLSLDYSLRNVRLWLRILASRELLISFVILGKPPNSLWPYLLNQCIGGLSQLLGLMFCYLYFFPFITNRFFLILYIYIMDSQPFTSLRSSPPPFPSGSTSFCLSLKSKQVSK